MTDTQDRYINIPWTVVANQRISERSKIIYGIIQGYPSGKCRITDDYLVETLGCSPRAVQRALKELKDANLLYTRFRTKDGIIMGRTLHAKGNTVKSKKPKDGFI